MSTFLGQEPCSAVYIWDWALAPWSDTSEVLFKTSGIPGAHALLLTSYYQIIVMLRMARKFYGILTMCWTLCHMLYIGDDIESSQMPCEIDSPFSSSGLLQTQTLHKLRVLQNLSGLEISLGLIGKACCTWVRVWA